ncbi:MAG: metallophosphoesterase [Phycisphaerales bacterium]|nr:MAG: metallophosphoesterase [Phycisphaerales bacterium]
MRRLTSHQWFLLPALCVLVTLLAPVRVWGRDTLSQKPVRFGICADVHKDIMHDADERLRAFIDGMNRRQVDFIIQLGDFCRPYARNDGFMSIWRSFKGPGYHVLGNHDMDGGFAREQTAAYYEMPARYYTFDRGGFRFIVLDGNDQADPPQPGYARYLGAEQRQWLRRQLKATDRPVVIFSHQSLETVGGVENAAAIRTILENANRTAGKAKVIACFSGHHHIDHHRRINGIDYIQINSMSYFWMGEKYRHVRYSEEIDKAYPWIKRTAPYRNPLFALVTLGVDGTIRIEGTQSTWVGPAPWDLGYPKDQDNRIVPAVSDRQLKPDAQ